CPPVPPVPPPPVPPPPVAQCAAVIVSLINVTAPLRASARPSTVTPLPIEIDVKARMLPLKTDDVPSVAELPICQNTLHGCAPLMRFKWLPDAVVNVEPAWKMKTALGFPWSSSVRAPVSPSEDADL